MPHLSVSADDPLFSGPAMPTHIVMITTEAVPLAKTGGLADVCGSLPPVIHDADHHVTLIMPAFASIYRSGLSIESTDISFAIDLGPNRLIGGRLLRTELPAAAPGVGAVEVLLIDQPQYFAREGLYGPPGDAYADNDARFIFFARAAIVAMGRWFGEGHCGSNHQDSEPRASDGATTESDGGTTESDGSPSGRLAGAPVAIDIIHCHDWQSALVPALLQEISGASSRMRQVFERTKTVLTIHNLGYQGHFGGDSFPMTGLDWAAFRSETFEYYGGMNFLKTGLLTADKITTVSPRYAEEICTPIHGCGLDGILRSRQSDLVGILNGIDTSVWNPRADPHLFANYGVEDWRKGKAANKSGLQEQLGLPVDADVPLLGLVGRLAQQKGWDMILPVMVSHLQQRRPVQWAVLGSGDGAMEAELSQLREAHPENLGLHIGFDEALAHRIEAGADAFVMPSHYEPCGLNQLYSLRYGTVPIVTPTGGLWDTVVDATADNLRHGIATGLHLGDWTPEALDAAIGQALSIRYHEPQQWEQMVRTGMSADWSWDRSGQAYRRLYRDMIGDHPFGDRRFGDRRFGDRSFGESGVEPDDFPSA